MPVTVCCWEPYIPSWQLTFFKRPAHTQTIETTPRTSYRKTWIQAYKSRHTFRGDAPVFEWLRRVMETTGTDRVRTLLRRRAKAAEWLMESVFGQPEESDVHAKLAAVELRVRLIQALVRLPARQCDVMVARFLGGLTIRQIAVNLGIAEGTVKATLAQATERLRGALGSTPPD